MKKMSQKKTYVKPEWIKQEMFERFAMGCDKVVPPATPDCTGPPLTPVMS
jgi:hypothetical protein